MTRRFWRAFAVFCGLAIAATGLCRHCIEVAEWLNFIDDGGQVEAVPKKYRAEIQAVLEKWYDE